jgi:predicted nucleic acid-binding protein
MVVPSIVLQELLSGVKTEAAFARLDDSLSGFPLLLPTRAIHVQAAHLRSRCRAHGVAAATVDCLIAAHTVAVGGRLFTLDEDFQRIAKLGDLELFKI